jgi:hypothetical protein
LPTALVTGSPERVPDITLALKSAGFDILAAGAVSPADTPDRDADTVDCYLHLPADQQSLRSLVRVLAEAVFGDSGIPDDGLADRPVEGIAAPAGDHRPDPLPWWLYAGVDPDLQFADWRNSVLCLTSPQGT